MVGFFAALFAAVGILSWARDANTALRVIGVVVLVAAGVLVLVAWGLLNSVRIDRLSEELDAELAAQIAHHDAACNCGHSLAESPAATVSDRSGGNETETTSICGHHGASGATNSDCTGDDCGRCALAALRSN